MICKIRNYSAPEGGEIRIILEHFDMKSAISLLRLCSTFFKP